MSEQPQAYLLAISIGPVQDFIAASRKARDLWFGSDMLSELSRTAADTLKNAGAELIFPAPASLQQGHSVANKLLVSTTSSPEVLAANAKATVDARIERFWNEAIGNRLDGKLAGAVDIELARAQRQDVLEWYAAWVAYEPERYAECRMQVERLLAGRKALRDFGRATGVDQRPKSSLDPARESILIPNEQQAGELVRRLHIKSGETLDAISLIKRLAGENRFVSTARVAFDPFIREAEDQGITSYEMLLELLDDAEILSRTDLVEKFQPDAENGLTHYGVFPYDTQLFYEQSSKRAVDQFEPWGDDPSTYDKLVRAAEDFIEHAKKFRESVPDMGEPPAYFAVLRADGDRMGKALNALTTPEAHIAFSERLGTFAVAAEGIVNEHAGAMIYSGGDDVLAFLPIDTALPCADALRLEFERIMKEALQHYPGVDLPTLSVGIAFGHFSDHLQHLLQRSGDAERAAKKPRNALAVSFETRSGGGDSRTVVHSWEVNPVYSTWLFAIEAHRHDAFPDGAAYELGRLRQELTGAWVAGVFGDDKVLLHQMVIKEVGRILERKRSKRGTAAIDSQLRTDLVQRLDRVQPGGIATLHELQSLVDELIVARKIAPFLPDSASKALALWNGLLQPVEVGGVEPVREGLPV